MPENLRQRGTKEVRKRVYVCPEIFDAWRLNSLERKVSRSGRAPPKICRCILKFLDKNTY
ncbi:hypothetical protein V2J09_006909 [Rumex salicifolius]